ncbi:hypothetical protein C7E17_26820, partial [Stenotrophomonas maltophilia]
MQVGGDFFDTLHVTGVHADEIHASTRRRLQPGAALRNAGVQVGGDFFDTLHVTGVHADEIHASTRRRLQP